MFFVKPINSTGQFKEFSKLNKYRPSSIRNEKFGSAEKMDSFLNDEAKKN